MKRTRKPWQEKVDGFCLKYLEVCREARGLMSQVAAPQSLSEFVGSPNLAAEVFEKHPELRGTKAICLTPEFVQMLEAVPNLKAMAVAGEHVYPTRIANTLEMMQTLALFPSLPPEVRMNAYFMLALWIAIGKDFWGNMRRMQYGAAPLDEAKVATLAAQCFEMLARFCRGRIPQTKGRYNLELIELVKIILQHQTEEMSPHDLREALAAAGMAVPEGETWRVWLWRARRDGLIPALAKVQAGSKRPQEKHQ
jgi:hypothetical protein